MEQYEFFLNTRGKNDEEVTPELVELLHYLEDTTDVRAQKAVSDRIRRIHERVRKVKSRYDERIDRVNCRREKQWRK